MKLKTFESKEIYQKNAKKGGLIFAAIGVAMLVAGIVITIFHPIGVFLILLGAIFLPISVVWFFNQKGRIKRSFCPACGKKYSYDSDIGWETESVEEEPKKVTALVNLECRCASCGETQIYQKKAVIRYYDGSKWVDHNIKSLVRNMFVR